MPTPGKIFAQPPATPNLAIAGEGWSSEHMQVSGEVLSMVKATGFTARYDQATQTYLVTIPSLESGTLYQASAPFTVHGVPVYYADVASSAADVNGSYGPLTVVHAGTPGSRYSYVSLIEWSIGERGAETYTDGAGAFGIAQPTAAGDVPTTGRATYIGDVVGHLTGVFDGRMSGTAQFDFDFGSAQLSGRLDLVQACMMGCAYPVQFRFTDTSFLRGATTFDGKLATPGELFHGTFSGQFAGPGAAELMATFEVPHYVEPIYGQQTSMAGVIVAKKN